MTYERRNMIKDPVPMTPEPTQPKPAEMSIPIPLSTIVEILRAGNRKVSQWDVGRTDGEFPGFAKRREHGLAVPRNNGEGESRPYIDLPDEDSS